MRPGIDIIVVNYRTSADLTHFLMSFERHPPAIPWTLTVVNVAPTDEDVRVAWDCQIPHDYKEFEDNVGYARAVNYVSTWGDRQTLGIFNADVRFLNDACTILVNELDSHPDWGVIGPRQIDNEGRITHGGFFPKCERGFHHRNSDEYGDIRPDALTVSGSAYFIKRNLWQELTDCPLYRGFCEAEGAFLPTQHYFEETFCSYHAREHGYKVVYYGPTTLIHQWHRASPPGGAADQHAIHSRELFRAACDAHGIQW